MRTASDSGYLKGCNGCGRTIYMKEDSDGKWRPYESWIAGNCGEGEWVSHACRAAFAQLQGTQDVGCSGADSCEHPRAGRIDDQRVRVVVINPTCTDDLTAVQAKALSAEISEALHVDAVKAVQRQVRSPLRKSDVVHTPQETNPLCESFSSDRVPDENAASPKNTRVMRRGKRSSDDDHDNLHLQDCQVCGYAFLGSGDTCRHCERDESYEDASAMEQAMREMIRGSNDFDWDMDDNADDQ
jgi:hypothetical protein